MGRIQDFVREVGEGGRGGGRCSDKLLPTLSNCYCYLTSRFFTRKGMVKMFAFVSL